MNKEIQKNDLSKMFLGAVANQMDILTKSTGKTEDEIKGLLISFAYATKQMLEASKQSMANIDPMSIKEAFKASLDTGIPVDKKQLAYVIKYGNAIQYQLGYKGFIHRIKEIFPNSVVKAEIVYNGDTFEVTKTDGQVKYVHKLKNPFADIKDMAGVYAYIEYIENGKLCSFMETMTVSEINKIKGCAKTSLVWNEWYGEMAKKAVIRRLCKTLFVGNPILQKLEEFDNKNYEFKTEPTKIDYDKVEPMPEEIQTNQADILEDTTTEETKEEATEQNTLPPTTNEEPVDNTDDNANVNNVNTDNTDDDVMQNVFVLKTFTQKEGKSKTGKEYTLTTLYLDNGTQEGLQVRTFDKKDFIEGQTVELVEWNKEKNSCKKVNILS